MCAESFVSISFHLNVIILQATVVVNGFFIAPSVTDIPAAIRSLVIYDVPAGAASSVTETKIVTKSTILPLYLLIV